MYGGRPASEAQESLLGAQVHSGNDWRACSHSFACFRGHISGAAAKDACLGCWHCGHLGLELGRIQPHSVRGSRGILLPLNQPVPVQLLGVGQPLQNTLTGRRGHAWGPSLSAGLGRGPRELGLSVDQVSGHPKRLQTTVGMLRAASGSKTLALCPFTLMVVSSSQFLPIRRAR